VLKLGEDQFGRGGPDEGLGILITFLDHQAIADTLRRLRDGGEGIGRG
jgi:hypothetical protein